MCGRVPQRLYKMVVGSLWVSRRVCFVNYHKVQGSELAGRRVFLKPVHQFLTWRARR